MNHPYTKEEYSVTIDSARYIKDFRDAERFIECCKKCLNYGTVWACPPFGHDWLPILQQYDTTTLFAVKIIPEEKDLPLTETLNLILPERKSIERRLRELEKETNGKAFAFAGTCLYCPEGTCARKNGEECRHPELVRPSLEAVGFDIGKTTTDLFGLELKWSHNSFIPEYLILVSALFHNEKRDLSL